MSPFFSRSSKENCMIRRNWADILHTHELQCPPLFHMYCNLFFFHLERTLVWTLNFTPLRLSPFSNCLQRGEILALNSNFTPFSSSLFSNCSESGSGGGTFSSILTDLSSLSPVLGVLASAPAKPYTPLPSKNIPWPFFINLYFNSMSNIMIFHDSYQLNLDLHNQNWTYAHNNSIQLKYSTELLRLQVLNAALL